MQNDFDRPRNEWSGKTILLVEDEALIALAERQILEKHGYHVVTARTGEKAVELALSTPEIDLVLMDINLGRGIDGTEAAEQILERRNLPLVFLSSHTDPEVVDKTERITSYGYIVKNSGETVLTASIKMAFRLFESRKIAGDTFEYSINGLCIHRAIYDAAGEVHDFSYVRVNDAYEGHTGISPEEVDGRTIREIYPNNEADEVIALYVDVLRTGNPARRELFFEPTQRWFELSMFSTRKDELSVVVQDITKRKAGEADMQRAQSMASIGSWRLELASGAVTASRQTRTIYGMGDGPLTLADIKKVPLSAHRAELDHALQALIEQGTPYDIEFEITRASDGKRRSIHSIAEYDRAQNIVIGTIQDVTIRKRMEETLREERTTFATIMEISPLGITTVDTEGNITYANAAAERILGLTRDRITDRRFNAPLWDATTLSGDPLQDEAQPFSIVKRTNAPVYNVRHEIRWPDGRRVVLSVNGAPMQDEAGEFAGMVASIEDITEREEPDRNNAQSLSGQLPM